MDRILPARPLHPEAERFGQHPSHGGHRPTHRRFESNTEPCTVPLLKAAWLQVGTLAGPRDPDTFLLPVPALCRRSGRLQPHEVLAQTARTG